MSTASTHDEALATQGLHLRSLDKEARSADFVASTEAIDSYGEIVEQSWKLERFKQNPVALFAHNSRELPIGSCTRVEVVDGKLETTIKFLPGEANPRAEQVWRCIQERALRAVSVGFVPGTIRYEKRDGKDVYVLAENELHEISVVPIPANPEALAKARSKARESARQTAERGGAPAHDDDGEPSMNIALIATVLGLAAGASATESDLVSAAKSAKDKADKLDAAEKELADVRKKLSTAEASVAELTVQRDAATKAEKAARDESIERDVKALVGVKITPDELDEMIDFAKSDNDRFKRQMAKRPELKFLKGAVVKDEPSAPPTQKTGKAGGQDLAALIDQDNPAA